MPTDSVSIEIRAAAEEIFDLIHDYDRRLDWDPFLRKAYLLNGAAQAGVGVSSRCVARWGVGGMAMDTVYVTFERPRVAAVKMTRGPALLKSFAATLRHDPVGEGTTRVTYRYRFTARPGILAPIIALIVNRIFHRETQQRLEALKRYFEDRSGIGAVAEASRL